MTNLPIQAFNGSIQNQSVQLINARDLYQFLQVKRDFSNWIKSRITDYNFTENEDYTCSPNLASEKNQGLTRFWGGQNKIDYHITLDMAKELCMLERSELGQQARRYFIQMEKEAVALATQNALLVEQAQQAFLTAFPEYKAIIRYREMGLTNGEIGKLLDLSRKGLELRLAKLFQLGLLERKSIIANQSQLALNFIA
ncbi:hypothetical protein A4G19_03655 [Pasteurellaceae bacterium Macca]|nr:hypothetical protein [Pasteurellaceae bacterium Macca]